MAHLFESMDSGTLNVKKRRVLPPTALCLLIDIGQSVELEALLVHHRLVGSVFVLHLLGKLFGRVAQDD